VTTLTAVTTFLNPSERANAHLRAGNAYLALENRARLFYRMKLLLRKQDNDLQRRLTRLVDELNARNTTSSQPPLRIFKRAARRGFAFRRQLTTAELVDAELRTKADALEPPADSALDSSPAVWT
jgi:hypothetical protein